MENLRRLTAKLSKVDWAAPRPEITEDDYNGLREYYADIRTLYERCGKQRPEGLKLFASPSRVTGEEIDVPEYVFEELGQWASNGSSYENAMILNCIEWAILCDRRVPVTSGLERMYAPLENLLVKRAGIFVRHGYFEIGRYAISIHKDLPSTVSSVPAVPSPVSTGESGPKKDE